jgi:hypothetical protein
VSRRYRSIVRSQPEPRASTLPVHRLDPDRSAALLDVVHRLQDLKGNLDESLYAERRSHPRRTLAQPVLVTPCENLDEPLVCESDVVMARDISSSGISFIHSRRLQSSQILVTLNFKDALPTCMLAVVRHIQPVRQGFYLAGTQFLQRVHLVNLESELSVGNQDEDDTWK